jgi:hypothetical protein
MVWMAFAEETGGGQISETVVDFKNSKIFYVVGAGHAVPRGVGELRPGVSFPVFETGEFRPDNILAVG